MTWKQVCEARPLEMRGVLAFMERLRPGSTRDIRAATPAQIASLVEPLDRGIDALPRVYLEFLKTMGDHSGALELTWGTTSINAIIAERSETSGGRADSNRHFKFSIGEDDYNGRHPDDFLDLARMRSDRCDAPVLRILEADLIQGKRTPDQPFASFSDLVRSVVVGQFGLDTDPSDPPVPFGLGGDADASARAYEFLVGLGFELTELGASPSRLVLEDPRRGALALLTGPPSMLSGTLLSVRLPSGNDGRQLAEVLNDYEARVRGLA